MIRMNAISKLKTTVMKYDTNGIKKQQQLYYTDDVLLVVQGY